MKTTASFINEVSKPPEPVENIIP